MSAYETEQFVVSCRKTKGLRHVLANDLIGTSIHGKHSSSTKLNTHLDHVNHYNASSNTN
jgi:hypothetical protein